MDIQIGDIAKCSQGKIGLVLEITQKLEKGYRRPLYKGVLLEGKIGGSWQSFNPQVLTNIEEILSGLR